MSERLEGNGGGAGTAAGTGQPAYLRKPAHGSGPGVLVLHGRSGMTAPLKELCDLLAEEGYVALAPSLGTLDREAQARALADAVDAVRSSGHHVGRIGALGFDTGGDLALQAAAAGRIDCAVAYDPVDPARSAAPARPSPAPLTIHFATGGGDAPGDALDALRALPATSIFLYPDVAPGFAVPGEGAHDRAAAAIAYSRSIAALKRTMGPHYNLEELWDFHLHCEFAARDAGRTMETMVAQPYVNHVPTMTGGVGYAMLKRFYTHHFVDQVPRDRKTIPISRTVGADRVVEEKVFCFTHDCAIDWLLPGIEPTGRYVEIPLVGIVTFRGDKLVNEHIYWDQASVLVQTGLLDPAGLPITGREQARKLLDKSLPSNELMPAWRHSAG